MTKKRILVVDDNDHQHELFRCYAMMATGIETVHVKSIEEAKMIAEPLAIDLVLLDSKLAPHESYVETVPLIRSSGFAAPIVVISADVNEKRFANADQHGVLKCVNKFDFNLRNFQDVVLGFMPG
jgi:DNA-binding NtrC family response regulator